MSQAFEVFPSVCLKFDASPSEVNEGQASAWAVADQHDVCEQNSSRARGSGIQQGLVRDFPLPSTF
jgi:hypothetical protein